MTRFSSVREPYLSRRRALRCACPGRAFRAHGAARLPLSNWRAL